MTTPLDIAREHWGPDLPDWVETLARACTETSQSKVAVRIGRSAALVSSVLRRRYPGNMTSVEELVRGHLLATTVDCPRLGVLPVLECRKWMGRAKDFKSPSPNPMWPQMYRACNRCPRFTREGNHG